MHITYPINALPRAIPLCLGVQSEYGARPISIDVSAWVGRWPDIVVSIQVVRPGEDASYPAVDVTREGNVVTWTPNAYDTEIPGSGSVEIVGLADGVKIIRTGAATSITATLTSTSKVPEEPLAAWADSVLKAGEQAKVDADRAADEADEAQQYARNAIAAANGATTAANTATSKAAEATERANDAGAAASTAQQHASAAAASAQAAAGSAVDLDEAVEAAAASASTADKYSTQAGYSANAASQSANLAAEAEGKALSNANTAVSNAMEAEGSAYAASQSAQQAKTSATTAASHATNAATSATKAQAAAGSAAAEVPKAEAAATAASDAADRAAAGATESEASAQASADNAEKAEAAAIRAETALANIPDDYTALAEAVRLKAQAIVNEQSGAVVVLTDAEPDEALSVVSHIDAADGVSEVSLTRTGRNLADINADTTNSTVSIFAQNGIATIDGTATSSTTGNVTLATLRLQPGTYTISHTVVSGSINASAENVSVITCVKGSSIISRTRLGTPSNDFTLTEEATVLVRFLRAASSTSYNQFAIAVQLEAGGTATDYEPPQHKTLTATLPETVAAGALDWTTGVLTINEDGATRTVQLVPQDLDLLKGYNALWSSTGDTYVRYTADLKSYIDSKLAAIAASVLNV